MSGLWTRTYIFFRLHFRPQLLQYVIYGFLCFYVFNVMANQMLVFLVSLLLFWRGLSAVIICMIS